MSSPSVVLAHRNLIANLARRDLKAKYKRSALGWLWSLINPAATLGVYTLVFGVFLRGVPPVAGNGTLQSFALYLFAGLVVWNVFAEGLNAAMAAMEASGDLLTKIYFPPECPAIASVLGVALQSAIEAAILIVVLIVLGNMSWTMLFVPVLLMVVLAMATGIGMVLSLLNIRYRDVGYLTKIVLQVLFYLTPIVYQMDMVPETVWGLPARQIMRANPIAQAVDIMRDLVWNLQLPSLAAVLYVGGIAAATFLASWWYFSRSAERVIEEL